MTPIFLIAGAPAVGKSTTARALAGQFQKSIHIPVDDLRELVVSGITYPGIWNDPLIEQLTLARESAALMGLKYSQAGFAVVIDDFWDPNSQLQEYGQLFQVARFHKVLLYPSLQTAEERNLKRSGTDEMDGYIAAGIQLVYGSLASEISNLERQGWIVVDTTCKSVEMTVAYILAQTGEHTIQAG